MTKEEYGEVRDIFLTALNAVNEAAQVFYETALDFNIEENNVRDIPQALAETGCWIGYELHSLLDVEETLEKLVGRAHQRATPRVPVSS